MKKNYLDFWKKGLTLDGMLMFTAFSTFAYEVKVEAEDAFDFYHSGTAVKVDTPTEETTASGGSVVANMASNNAIAFELTDVPADGTYDLSIVYFGTDTNRKCYIKVNKQKKSIVQFSEKSEDTSWNGTKGNPATIVTQVYLKAGTNRIKSELMVVMLLIWIILQLLSLSYLFPNLKMKRSVWSGTIPMRL